MSEMGDFVAELWEDFHGDTIHEEEMICPVCGDSQVNPPTGRRGVQVPKL